MQVSGAVSVNGASMGQSATGGERGRLTFKDADGSQAVGLAATDAASYRLSLIAGTYDAS